MMNRVIVFDFDGTLVNSNKHKYEAFFRIFPRNSFNRTLIKKVLSEFKEESRYVILEKILRLLDPREQDIDRLVKRVARYASAYNSIVMEAAKKCPSRRGAEGLLKSLHRKYRLYLSSVTPEKPLREIVRYRGWSGYFQGVFGYPADKVSTILRIAGKESIAACNILVVGDGVSDRFSAEATGAGFFEVKESNSFKKLRAQLL